MARTVRPRVFVTRQLPGEALGRPGRQVDLHVWGEEPPPCRDSRLAEAALAGGLVTLLTHRVDAGLLAAAPGPRAPWGDDLPAHCVNPELFP